MKILTLELKNFRQYYGEQKITFANDSHQNTTIVFGENGKGKTGIYRAIMFALFGSTQIPQDNDNDEIHLVNFLHIDEVSPNTADAVVIVEFEHEGQYYILKRSVLASKITKSRITEHSGPCELKFKDSDGNISPEVYVEKEQIKKIVNKIIDEEIKDFFLFDAEKIDTLTRDDDEIRKQVKVAILNLLQMDNIEEAKKVINLERRHVEDKLRGSTSDQELKSMNFRKNALISEIKNKKETVEMLQREESGSEKIIAEHTLTLKKNEEIIQLYEKIEENDEQISKLEEQLTSFNNELGNIYFKIAPYLILQSTLTGNAEELTNFLGKEKINIPSEIMHESLEKNSCIVCNNDLEKNIDNQQFVQTLLATYKYSETYTLARELLAMYNNRKANFQIDESRLNKLLKNYREVIQEINRLKALNEEHEKNRSEHAQQDLNLSELELTIQRAEKEKDEKRIKRTIELDNIVALERELDGLTEDLDRLYSLKTRNENEKKKFELLKELDESLKKISKEFNDDMRDLLGEETTQIFKLLIDEKDINLIKKVEINSKFEIKAIDYKDVSILNDISQGQRQILSLAFITALAKIAIKRNESKMIDYPLFMDSPFNRLSGNNRDHLIKNLPSLTAQWILLLTDTELTYSEETVFKQSGRLGKSYRIEQIEMNHSKIVEVGLEESMATRGGL